MVEAKKIKVIIDKEELEAEFRTFKSGKQGYGSYGVVKINGYQYRLSLNLIKM